VLDLMFILLPAGDQAVGCYFYLYVLTVGTALSTQLALNLQGSVPLHLDFQHPLLPLFPVTYSLGCFPPGWTRHDGLAWWSRERRASG
jgi:hypothetical protein